MNAMAGLAFACFLAHGIHALRRFVEGFHHLLDGIVFVVGSVELAKEADRGRQQATRPASLGLGFWFIDKFLCGLSTDFNWEMDWFSRIA
ncbi:MAG: hypothetical protein IT581_22690 [Verrucomicrobiales bacterium]|nr:hypothetical protein [Verrucomicrobiales bacterium]